MKVSTSSLPTWNASLCEGSTTRLSKATFTIVKAIWGSVKDASGLRHSKMVPQLLACMRALAQLPSSTSDMVLVFSKIQDAGMARARKMKATAVASAAKNLTDVFLPAAELEELDEAVRSINVLAEAFGGVPMLQQEATTYEYDVFSKYPIENLRANLFRLGMQKSQGN